MLIELLTEMCTRNLPGVKARPARKTDNFAASCEPVFFRKCGILDVSEPYTPPRPVTGTALLFTKTLQVASSKSLEVKVM
jgi:hypothetical protein